MHAKQHTRFSWYSKLVAQARFPMWGDNLVKGNWFDKKTRVGGGGGGSVLIEPNFSIGTGEAAFPRNAYWYKARVYTTTKKHMKKK